VLDEVYRAMPPWRKWELIDDVYRFGRSLHAAGVLSRLPGATPSQILDEWFATHLRGIPHTPVNEEPAVEQPAEFRRSVEQFIDVLDRLGIVYAVGGSIASSLHGISRSTIDADVIVEPFPGKEAEFVACFGPDFYVSLDAVRRAVRERSSFNIIQTTTGIKADVFVRKERPFERSVMGRRQSFTSREPHARPLFFVSPEDIILLKLEWYRIGNEVSERQWTDVQNVLRVQASRLDWPYLETWAGQLGVADLLSRARGEAAV
jgi:hypothetical protein